MISILLNFCFEVLYYQEITIGEIMFLNSLFNYSFICDGDHNKVIAEDVLYVKDDEQYKT